MDSKQGRMLTSSFHVRGGGVLGHSSIPASNAGEMEQKREQRKPVQAMTIPFHGQYRRQAAKQILNLFYGVVTVTMKSIQRRRGHAGTNQSRVYSYVDKHCIKQAQVGAGHEPISLPLTLQQIVKFHSSSTCKRHGSRQQR
jgi:hypothetical protein